MAVIFQKNQISKPENNQSLDSKALDSKQDLLLKSTKLQSLSELKFPGAEETKMAQAETLERSLNDVGGTALKVGLKGLVALSKAQQQLEDRSSQRAVRMQSNVVKPTDRLDPIANLLALFSMIKSSAVVRRFSKLFSKRIKQNTENKNINVQLEIQQETQSIAAQNDVAHSVITEREPKFDHPQDKQRR